MGYVSGHIKTLVTHHSYISMYHSVFLNGKAIQHSLDPGHSFCQWDFQGRFALSNDMELQAHAENAQSRYAIVVAQSYLHGQWANHQNRPHTEEASVLGTLTE